ncbi:MAG: DUF935 family protein [Victivallaceae bacterium]|nr:DUF935 family protein [Victivallaceae bacterium]
MLLDQFGRALEERDFTAPRAGRFLIPETSDRDWADVSYDLTPARVASIMEAADSGDAEDQARLAMRMLEKNQSIVAAFAVREKALTGLEWTIQPGDDSPEAAGGAEKLGAELRAAGSLRGADSFNDLLGDLLKAVLVGYALNEIIWLPGGSIGGFASIDPGLLDFSAGFEPRIRISGGGGYAPIEQDKYLWLFTRAHGSDPVRGGLIRPLAWIHCFSHLADKDLLTFAERYGMPFLVAKVTDDAFQSELAAYLKLVRSFGPRGGGVVKQGTEIEFAQAPNATGDIYFKMLERYEGIVRRLILGQSASSGDGGGLSKDNAQSEVRQDILESDAHMIESVVNCDLIAPWTRWNLGPSAPLPRLVFDVTKPEDVEAKYSALKEHADAIGVAVRGGIVTPTAEDEEAFRKVLGLPPMPESARAEWERTRGVRSPITLVSGQGQQQETAALERAGLPDTSDKSDKSDDLGSGEALEAHYGPMAEALARLADLDDGAFVSALEKLSRDGAFGSSEKLEEELAGSMRENYVRAVIRAAEAFKKRK